MWNTKISGKSALRFRSRDLQVKCRMTHTEKNIPTGQFFPAGRKDNTAARHLCGRAAVDIVCENKNVRRDGKWNRKKAMQYIHTYWKMAQW